MNKIISLSILLTLLSLGLKSQIGCGTVPPTVDSLSLLNPQAKALPLNNATIQLYFHIIRKSNGNDNNSISAYDAVQAFFGLAPIYNPQNICFVLLGIDYVDENDYYNDFDFSNASNASLISQNVTSNAIDVYIVPNSNSGIQGIAAGGIPGRAVIIQKQAMTNGKNIFSHELGHCLGLYHTFETQFCSENISTSPCGVGNNNSNSCGDLVCDTPADNNGSYNSSNCSYTGGGGYNPLVNNIMSYYDGCLSQFTTGQGERMLDVIANTQLLLDRLTPANTTIIQTTFPIINGPPQCNNPFPPNFCPPPIHNLIVIGKSKVSTLGAVIVNPYNPINNPFQYTTSIGFVSETEIELLPGFEAKQGVKFAAVISSACPASVNFRSNNSSSQNYIDEFFDQESMSTNTNSLLTDISKVNNISESSIFNIVPNPNNGSFKLTLNNFNELPKSITVCDAQGKEVKSILNPTDYEYMFNLNELHNGLYIINAFYNDKTVSKRFIIN